MVFYKVVNHYYKNDELHFNSIVPTKSYELEYTLNKVTKKMPGSIGIFAYADKVEALRTAVNLESAYILIGTGTVEPVQAEYYCKWGAIVDKWYSMTEEERSKAYPTAPLQACWPNVILLSKFKPTSVLDVTNENRTKEKF